MSLIVYLYPKCTTCQKALRFIEKSKVTFNTKDISLTPPSVSELKQMLNYYNGDVKKLFNTSGIMYRELNLSEKLTHMPLNDALSLLSQNGMLVKRPFLLGKDFGLVGFREEQWQNVLP